MEAVGSLNAFLYISRVYLRRCSIELLAMYVRLRWQKKILQDNQSLIQSGNAICKLCWLQVENGKYHAECGMRI